MYQCCVLKVNINLTCPFTWRTQLICKTDERSTSIYCLWFYLETVPSMESQSYLFSLFLLVFVHFYCRLFNDELYLLCFVVARVGVIVIFHLATTHCSLKTQSMVLTLSFAQSRISQRHRRCV